MSKAKSSKIAVDSIQEVIEVYKKDVDRTLIRENLKLTVEQRLVNLQNFQQFAMEMQEAGRKAHQSSDSGRPDD